MNLLDRLDIDREDKMNNYNDFIEYLLSVRRVSERTVKHYEGAIKTVSNELFSIGLLETSIFMIEDKEIVKNIKDIYWSIPQLKEKDERGNRMYSAALNRYWDYFNDRSKEKRNDTIDTIDTGNISDYHDSPRDNNIEVSGHSKEVIIRDA
jgi:site-specific recombinase XerD